jgi:hypothetical protein
VLALKLVLTTFTSNPSLSAFSLACGCNIFSTPSQVIFSFRGPVHIKCSKRMYQICSIMENVKM